MPRWKRWISDSAGNDADEGSASLEFITVGLILLVPFVYLVLAASSIQAGAFAVEGAARQAARVYVQSATDAEANARAARAIELTLSDYGFDASDADVRVECAPKPSTCLTREGVVTVTVRLRASLPLVPSVLDLQTAASVPLQASAIERVSRFWGAGR